MDLRKKLVNFDEGLTIYSQLLKDEEAILIPFTISQYATIHTIDELLPEFLADLKRNECKESLCIDFDQMTSVDYWMGKLAKLRSDMERLGTVTMKEHGFVVTILGFSPETTMDLYHAIEQKIIEMVEMLAEVQRILNEAPAGLYENFYRHLRAQFCEDQAVKDFGEWMRRSGKMSLCKLKSFQAQAIADYVNSGILKCCVEPSEEERSQVDIEAFKKQLPNSYPYAEWFGVSFTVFCRTVSWQGDIIVPDYACAGLFIFQHWQELAEEDIRAIFYLDKMLELIHREMTEQNHDDVLELSDDIDIPELPKVLNTPEAKELLKKARKAGYLDDRFQPKISNTLSALLANQIAEKLEIENKWKVFEAFWRRHDMYKDYHKALTQAQCPKFLKTLYQLYG